jgi:hypothetical protein
MYFSALTKKYPITCENQIMSYSGYTKEGGSSSANTSEGGGSLVLSLCRTLTALEAAIMYNDHASAGASAVISWKAWYREGGYEPSVYTICDIPSFIPGRGCIYVYTISSDCTYFIKNMKY